MLETQCFLLLYKFQNILVDLGWILLFEFAEPSFFKLVLIIGSYEAFHIGNAFWLVNYTALENKCDRIFLIASLFCAFEYH